MMKMMIAVGLTLCLSLAATGQFTPDLSADLIRMEGGKYSARVAYQLSTQDAQRHIVLTVIGAPTQVSTDHFSYFAGYIAWNLKSFFDHTLAGAAQQAFWPDYHPDSTHWSIVSGIDLKPDLNILFFVDQTNIRYRIKLRDFYTLSDYISMPNLRLQEELAHRLVRGYSRKLTQESKDQAYQLSFVMRSTSGVSRSFFCFMLGVLDTEYYAPYFRDFFPYVAPLPLTLAKVWDDDNIHHQAFGNGKGDIHADETYRIIMSGQQVRFESSSDAGDFGFSVTYDDLLNDFESF